MEENENCKEQGKWKNKKAILLIVGILFGIYFIISIYFTSHFYFGTSINSIDVSGKTAYEAEKMILDDADSYVVNVKGREGVNAEIKGEDIDYKIVINNEIKELLDKQSAVGWVKGLYSKENSIINSNITYNEEKLKSSIDSLPYLTDENIVEPKNAVLEFNDGKYSVVKEVMGTTVNYDNLVNSVKDSLSNYNKDLSLEESNCYENPTYREDSEVVKSALETLNKYILTEVSYNVEGETYKLDNNILNTWLSVDENYNVQIDEAKVKDYVSTLAKPYNTIGKTREFKTSLDTTIKVSGGDYGKTADITEEVNTLLSLIKEGSQVQREPEFAVYSMTSGGNDIGDTYVEISLNNQHIWFYKNGNLITQGDIVTGNLAAGYGTPAGVYKLKYKQRDAVLVGDDYRTPVTFWMPFNGGIGLHDANWRVTFGGQIYRNAGSHGCINLPYSVAEAIYNNIESGTAVVCY